jgi:O-antigen ligase
VNTQPEHCPPALASAYVLLFATLPFSVDCAFGNFHLDLPSEPLLLLMGLYLAWSIAHRPPPLARLSSLVFISAFWILWMLTTAICSSMPIVSLKYWLVEAGQWWVFGIGLAVWPELWRRVLPWFGLSMLVVAAYTIAHHSAHDFRADQAILAPMPFFFDHTLYGTVLAMLLFFVAMPGLKPPFVGWQGLRLGMMAFFAVALTLSSSRAAMVSVVAASVVYAFLQVNKKWRICLAVVIVLGGMGGFAWKGEQLRQKWASDVSSQERLNRWDCAATMLAEKPWIGFGPGAFAFQYIAFQKEENLTRISLREPLWERNPSTYGRGGGAHSEYWQAAAEMGWVGLFLWSALVFTTLWMGFQRVVTATNQSERLRYLLMLLGLLTYFIHALVNNFLHDGRVAALVWGGVMYLARRKS